MNGLPQRQSSAAAAASRASSGVSRLAMMQARFQAQQLVEKEEKLIHLLEQRQEEAVRRVAYPPTTNTAVNGRTDSAASHSANSMSSNNSSNSIGAGIGVRPGRVRQMFEERRRAVESNGNSPVGWDKSYPLKPVGGGGQNGVGLYKRNSNAGTSSNAIRKPNKYSGNYGPKRSLSQNRGMSLDRNYNRYAGSNESGYSSSTMQMNRTRSHHQLGNSSGEDSYGSTSRPASRDYNTYAPHRRGSHPHKGVRRIGYDDEDDDDYANPRPANKTSYTREYVRNLPPTTSPSHALPPKGGRRGGGVANRTTGSRPQAGGDSSPSGRSSFEHSSFSSQSSEPGLPPSRSHSQLYDAEGPIKQPILSSSRTEGNLSHYNSGIDTKTYRKSRSPSTGALNRSSYSRSPSHSPVRSTRLLGRPRQQNGFAQDYDDGYGRGISAYQEHAERAAFEKQQSKDREEEKRRLQIEMRKREQDLLERIKKQQMELENVKQEKSKVERELHRQELLRERSRKATEEKRLDEERARAREREQRRRQEDEEREAERRRREQVRRQEAEREEEEMRQRRRERAAMALSPRKQIKERVDPFEASEEAYSPTRRSTPAVSASANTSPVKKRGLRTTINISAVEQNKGFSAESANSKGAMMGSSASSTTRKPKAPTSEGRRSLFAPKPRDDLTQCSNCGRNFAEDRIQKHQDICLKSSKKKRKTFDMTKKRTQGTEAESFVRRSGKKGAAKQAAAAPAKKSDWRKKREEFVNAMRAAKAAQRHIAAGGKISDLPPPPPMDTSDYVPCPHCGRKFNDAAAERHIPKCKNIRSNKR